MEPELGLGLITEIDVRFVRIRFPAGDCERQYAIASAPIKRVQFSIGDTVKTQRGVEFQIKRIEQSQGLIIYHGEDIILPENELSDSLAFTSPRDRLLAGLVDSNRDFNFRYKVHQFQHKVLKSRVRGFLGGRIELIPHQMYVAHETASRHIPRVLLADEVGLGKTIEACLVVHRLLQNGRIDRVLILVPESLVHQWFVELLRRFNLLFHIIDREYCDSRQETNPDANLFLDQQLALCSMDFLSQSEKWGKQAVDAGWDMLIIDEAHHLTEQSAAYQLAEKLCSISNGVLLLTATPEQLGHKSHFERLRLLDPARYHDYDLFEKEADQYHAVAKAANKLLDGKPLDKADLLFLSDFTKQRQTGLETLDEKDRAAALIEELLDRHGMGRVMFRNTRAAMSGFPQRIPHLVNLAADAKTIEKVNSEVWAELEETKIHRFNYRDDPRIHWLTTFFKKHRKEKVLLICRSIEKVFAIHAALQDRINVKTALFHEKLTLIQRDRHAAWFAEKDGAQLLVCSEIGSEGRNFQFAHTLILFDLPLDPELLEQRIGRLDRIGQKKSIQIYVPYIAASAQEVLVRWYHEGLNAIEKNVPGAYQIYQAVKGEVEKALLRENESSIEQLIDRTKQLREETALQLQEGRDRLLELHSFRPKVSQALIRDIRIFDKSNELDQFMLAVFDRTGIRYHDLDERTFRINFDHLQNIDFPIPPMRSGGMTATFERKTALNHEEMEFLTWDHPMVIGSIDVLLGSESGNSALAVWPHKEEQEILLEAIFVFECVAPKRLNADRFLPPTPIRIIVNHSMQDCSDLYPPQTFARVLRNATDISIFENPQIKADLFPAMLDKCREHAALHSENIKQDALQEMENLLHGEIDRLVSLAKINPNIRKIEIAALRDELQSLQKAITSARLRLDALRFIFSS
ncbi:MAG: RNA polymerase-associated protein RapA [Actinobacteria bacterium]|nr:RNA polymerase-associated protein RapA [Actinomycetota bacterium]